VIRLHATSSRDIRLARPRWTLLVSAAMKHMQPVIWSKGTFLTPQHLQAQDLYLENTLRFRLDALTSFTYGFTSLVMDLTGLATGEIAVGHASGIMPDGLLFDMPDSDRLPKPRNIAEFFSKDTSAIDVYLSIPSYRYRGLNVSAKDETAGTRYGSELQFIRDENTGSSEKPVQVARKNFSFLFEGENREGNSTLRIARVKRTRASTFELDPLFVPPLLNCAANEYVFGIARRLTETLSSRSRELAEARRQKSEIQADFTASEIENFWLLYTVNSFLPVVRHVLETRQGHPEMLFSTILSLAASLTTFSTRVQPRDLPNYNHEDLSDCFMQLEEKLRFLLEAAPPNFVSLPLKQDQPSLFTTQLDDDRLLVNTKLYLAISAEMNKADLIQKGPVLLKACSTNQIEEIVKRALQGLPLTHARPGSIPMKLKHQYFAVSQTGSCWESLVRSRNFSVYVPADFPDPQLELIVVLPSKT
jgi:type VI secretion system protein ImpJ